MIGWQTRSVSALLISLLAGAPALAIVCGMKCAVESQATAGPSEGHHHGGTTTADHGLHVAVPMEHHHSEEAAGGLPVSPIDCVSARECGQLFAGVPGEAAPRADVSHASAAATGHNLSIDADGAAHLDVATYHSPPGESPLRRSVVLRV